MAGEGVDVLEAYGGVVGDQRPPVLRGGGRDRCDAELEVGAGVVVHDQEDVFAGDDGVVEGVLEALAALGEDLPAGVRVVGVEVAVLRGDLRPGRDHQEPVGARAADADPEAAVGLVVDQLVVGLAGAEAVPPDLVGAPGVVDGRVVEVLAGAVPGGSAERAGDLVAAQLAGREVLHADRVALVADDVGGVGEQGAVGADRRAAEREELVALGERVQVDEDLLTGQGRLVGVGVLGRLRGSPVVGVGDRDPAAGAVLLAGEGATVVPVAAVAGRHGQVGLAGACLDLVEDRLAQVGEVRGALLGVGVLGLEVGRDVRRLLVTQPLVVVGAGVAVDLGAGGALVGDGGLHAVTIASAT